MLKVLIVDDEPFIVQGLCVLIDWAREGYEIVRTAANGQEALEYLEQNQVDLIMTDIRMPEMNGLDLLVNIREKGISDAHCIILSGYQDFNYMQTAIRYDAIDYVLKPVQREELLRSLRRVSKKEEIRAIESENSLQMKRAYMQHSLISLIHGKYENQNLEFVRSHLKVSEDNHPVRYVHIHPSDIVLMEELDDEECGETVQKIVVRCREFLKEDEELCIRDIFEYEEDYDIGFIYCEEMARKRNLNTEQFMSELLAYITKELQMPIVLLVGKSVEDISKISHSYVSASMLRSFQKFRAVKDIYYYEEEMQNTPSDGIVLCNESLEKLIHAVELNDKVEINESVDSLFNEIEHMGIVNKSITMNINYLLFRFIYLAVEQDKSVNQEEVMRYISENSFETGITRGSRCHLRKFACEYAEYLIQLRGNISRDIFHEIEKEVEAHYPENLTLRDLGQKYYVNSSYLGQIFRKKYGQSFKDYLCSYRIERAASELLHSGKKINQIAEEVGYRDVDYFISKFIAQKGCTPSKFRKQASVPEIN